MSDRRPPTNIDAVRVRQILGRDWWPPSRYGEDGWYFDRRDRSARIIASCAPYDDAEWIHASMSRAGRVPDYDDLVLMHRAVFGDGWAYQVFAPPSAHINLHEHCLHLWGRLDGQPVLPDFGAAGTI
jgi:hypothetical protein